MSKAKLKIKSHVEDRLSRLDQLNTLTGFWTKGLVRDVIEENRTKELEETIRQLRDRRVGLEDQLKFIKKCYADRTQELADIKALPDSDIFWTRLSRRR